MSADEATQQALGALGAPSVTSATVIDAPADSGDSGQWLSVAVDSNDGDSNDGDSVKQEWLAQLLQGAVEDLMRTNQTTTSGVLDGAQLVDRNQSGKTVVTYLGHGGVVGGQVFESPSDEALRHQVQAAAEKYGLTVDSVEILHPLESALAVAMTVPDGPLHGWTLGSLEGAIEGGGPVRAHTGVTPNVEGLYLELRSPTGRPLLKSSYAFRVPGGSAWTAPGQADRFGIQHG